MIAFIEDHRADHGVEPICRVLPIAPATFYDNMAKRADPSRLSDRAKRDEQLKPEIERVFEENLKVYGVRKVWHQMHREGFDIARCTVARLMKDIGIEGVIRGKKPRTTIPDCRVALKSETRRVRGYFLPLIRFCLNLCGAVAAFGL
ncbi:IS3 family transposase [Epibacterium sp. SM1979]|uniref:IS3 family transposase n=1 Tax=Tritonibacter litoralis TaxID=2662264 RepID=A0A843YHF0_9RHOB|nr:IS3 family transposase [Tritonibacter litoralis]